MGHGKNVAGTDYGVVQLSPQSQTVTGEGVVVGVVHSILVAHAALETGIVLRLVLMRGRMSVWEGIGQQRPVVPVAAG